MKLITKYILIITVVLLASCKDFLSQDSPSRFLDEFVYGSEEEIQRAITGIYAPMTEDPMYSGRFYTVFKTNNDVDLTYPGSATIPSTGVFTNYCSRSVNSDTEKGWAAMYKTINRANLVIAGIEGSELWNDPNTPSANLKHMYGEAKTMRALLYFDLIRNWGDVPFRVKPSTYLDKFDDGLTDRDSILTYLINDLRSVEPDMKWAKDIPYGVEKANRELCQGLIANMSLNRGGWKLRPYLDDPSAKGYMDRSADWKDYYAIAETYLRKTVESGNHKLTKSFEQFWIDQNNLISYPNDDMIYEISMAKGFSSEFGYYLGIPIDTKGTTIYGTASGSQVLSRLYQFSFDTLDLRLPMTCSFYGYDTKMDQIILPTSNSTASNMTGAPVAKWNRVYFATPPGVGTAKYTGIDNPYMRYAEILLMYAEVLNENNGGPTEEAKEALKQVRRRAFAPVNWPTKVDQYVEDRSGSKDDFFQAIVDEQAWEFGGETKRSYALARWNLFSKVVYNTYWEIIDMGRYAQGLGGYKFPDRVDKYAKIPSGFWWRSVPFDNPYPKIPGPQLSSSHTKIEVYGFYEKKNSQPAYGIWTSKTFASLWWDKTNNKPCGAMDRLFLGYISPANQDVVNPDTDPVPYLFAYPGTVISSSNGKIKNYYGNN